MIKKIIISISIVLLVLFAGYKIFFSDKVEDQLKDINKVVNKYHMEANMEIGLYEDVRKFFVNIDYEKQEEDTFRISLLDKDVNQEQILIRNPQGVFVLTPVLNQVYTFKGDYPLNSSKPYLYQSFIKALEGEYEVQNLNDGYLITYDCTYENEPNWIKQELKLSNSLKPIWTYIYDKNNDIVCKVIFTKVDFNPTFEKDHFDVDNNMKCAKENISENHVSTTYEDLPLIPLQSDALLKEQTKIVDGDKISYMLTFEGSKSYTVLQTLISKNEEDNYLLNKLNGEFVSTMYGICYTKGKVLNYLYHDVEYEVYSNDLSIDEMIDVVTNMEIIMAK